MNNLTRWISALLYTCLIIFSDRSQAQALLHSAIDLHHTDDAWDFDLADWNLDGKTDLVSISKKGGNGKTEIHVLDGATDFHTFLWHSETALGHTDEFWSFCIADWNQDNKPDLVGILRKGGSNQTEVHILNGANSFQTFLLQTKTALAITDDSWQFDVFDWNHDKVPDLVGILKKGGSNSTELHVLNGAANFGGFLLQTPTKLHQTDENWSFGFIFSKDNDSVGDLIGFKKKGTGTNATELHGLSSTTNYQAFFVQMKTVLGETDRNWILKPCDWNNDGVIDICGIFKKGGSGKTEMHIYTTTEGGTKPVQGIAAAAREETTSYGFRIEGGVTKFGKFSIHFERTVVDKGPIPKNEAKPGQSGNPRNDSKPSPGPPPKPSGPRP